MQYLDVGGWSFIQAYRGNTSWAFIDSLAKNNTIFCIDSSISLRREHLSWYKAQRANFSEEAQELKRAAHKLQEELFDRHWEKCIVMEGLEADDVIALYAKDEDTIIASDKDFLTLPTKATLVNYNFEPWGISRIKSKLPLERGAKFLAYQLLMGDAIDNIPRLIPSSDRKIAKRIFSLKNPLEVIFNIFPENLIENSLRALMLPTPLFWPNENPIALAREIFFGKKKFDIT